MKKKYIPCQLAAKNMDSAQLRESFLIDDLFARGSIDLYYTDCDRAVVGSACPASSPLKLEAGDELRADFFCQRRELGILNIGGTGTVVADGMEYKLARGESLYIGRGTKDISFASDNSDSIAEFYLLSYPAHKQYPTLKSALGDANMLHLGEQSQANVRTINQVICQARIQSAQLVMGYTKLEEGSVWNTMPYARAEVGNLYVFRHRTGRMRFPLYGLPARDATYRGAQQAGCPVAVLVDTFRMRNAQLYFLLGNGRRKPKV